jgi:Amiloride-sensitive sodium channel
MVETTLKFLEDKIVIELSREEVPISSIPFPAVTICPEVELDEKFQSFNNVADPSDDKCDKHKLVWISI